jgi:hypothetical protein
MFLSRIWIPVLMFLLFMIGLSVSIPDDRVVQSREVQEKIKAGGLAQFDNCIIIGDLDLSSLKIEGPVDFSRTIFRNSVNFGYTIFNGTADFRNSMFVENASFFNSSFKGPADFQHTLFNGSVDIRISTFDSQVNFDGSKFNGTADFWNSTFNGLASFWNSTFINNANFGMSRFSNIYFGNVMFNNTTSFLFTTFNGPASWGSSTFNGYADFRGSTFNSKAEFWGSKFNGYADFFNTTFNNGALFFDSKFNTTDFTDAKFNKEALFDDAQFNGITLFYKSQFKEDASFENTIFKGKLYLIRTKYNKFYIRWANIEKSLIYDETAYLLIIENFKKLGFFDDADNAYYQFRKEQFLHRNLIETIQAFFMSLILLGAWIFYGFGKMPILPFLWSIFFIGIFGVFWIAISLPSPKYAINKYNLDKGLSRRAFSLFFNWIDFEASKTAIDEYDQVGKWPSKMRDAFIFSFTIFLSGTKVFVDPPVIPVIPGRSQSLIRRAFLFERLLGAFFSILFFMAIGATIVRQ